MCNAKENKESENCQGSPGNSAIDNELHRDIDIDAMDSWSEENLSDSQNSYDFEDSDDVEDVNETEKETKNYCWKILGGLVIIVLFFTFLGFVIDFVLDIRKEDTSTAIISFKIVF